MKIKKVCYNFSISLKGAVTMKKSPKFWAALGIFSLVGQIAWVMENMYFNVFIYKIV